MADAACELAETSRIAISERQRESRQVSAQAAARCAMGRHDEMTIMAPRTVDDQEEAA